MAPLTALMLAAALPACAGLDDLEGTLREAAGRVKEDLAASRQASSAGERPQAQELFPCPPESSGAPKLATADFHWDYTLPEMLAAFEKTYASDKRLGARAYWNPGQRRYELPYEQSRGGAVVLPARLIASVARHIEAAFAADYIDAVFFPDMGHSHLLIPQELWKKTYDPYPVDKFSRLYEAMFDDPRVEVFYHTAEQLKMLEPDKSLVADERVRWRHKTRNIAGLNTPDAELKVLQNPESNANTVHEVPGYFWWGGGFNFSANKDGCFAYRAKGKTYRFDISLYDLGE
ncbi:MAG: hypothetical protein PHU21_04370 [Elusimicrobia bacterium]|nr:hypothetical protein [Elusimicrobiota bacterium]